MTIIRIHDKEFEPLYSEGDISARVQSLGSSISANFKGKDTLLIGVMNGAMIFMADLMREISIPIEIGTIRASSYVGLKSSGKVEFSGLERLNISGRHVILVEDIVDTGKTLHDLTQIIKMHSPASVSIATLLFKKEAFGFTYPINYVGFEIPNKFVVGYGLDYDQQGRNLPAIYQLHNDTP